LPRGHSRPETSPETGLQRLSGLSDRILPR
jgi:hypothetical protein